MAQRNSEYPRKAFDVYETTPEWVTQALRPHLPDLQSIWEPAAGSGKMADVFKSWGVPLVFQTDIRTGNDFLRYPSQDDPPAAIITNPPYSHGLAQKFVEHALKLMRPNRGVVAMLMSTDFDSAAGRRHIFEDCPAFKKKIILTKRIVWFKRTDGKKEAPSTNHAWYLWDWRYRGDPTISYHYEPGEDLAKERTQADLDADVLAGLSG